MHVVLRNFEIRRNSSSKIWHNNTCYGCRRHAVSQTHQTRTSPLVRVQLFLKLGGRMLFVILKISHILSFYIHGSILYLHFCYTLYIYLHIFVYIYIQNKALNGKLFTNKKCFFIDFTYCVKISVRSDQ